MAANTNPIFPLTPVLAHVLVGSSALTSRAQITGTTGLTLVHAAGTNGTRYDWLILKGTGTTVAGVLDIWIYAGTNSLIFQSVTIPVVTPSTIVDSYFNQVALNPLILPTGYSIYCSSQVASQLVNVAVQGGSY